MTLAEAGVQRWRRWAAMALAGSAAFLLGLAAGHYGRFPAPQLGELALTIKRVLAGGADALLVNEDAVAAAATMPWTDAPADIIFVGDSLTARGPWNELFPGLVLHNRGVDGDTIGGLTLRAGQLIAKRPRRVVVMIGVNDLMLGNRPGAIAPAVDALLARLAPHMRVTLLAVLHCAAPRCTDAVNARVVELNKALALLAKRRNVEFLDFNPSFARGARLRAELTNDGVHPNAAGYRLWRDLLRPHLCAASACVGPGTGSSGGD